MNLDSIEALTLLRNCTILEIIKLQKAKKQQTSEVSENALDEFNNLFLASKKGDSLQTLIQINSSKSPEFADFISYFFKTSAPDISKHYLGLAESILTTEQFEKIKSQFKQHIEPEIEQSAQQEPTYLTPNIQSALNELNTLIKQNNPKVTSPTQFKTFSTQYRDLTKFLIQSKFQQYFDTQGKQISNMQLLYDTAQSDRTVYKTIIQLLDSSAQSTEVTIKEPAPASNSVANYYQNACYAYFKGHSCSQLDESLLDQNIMTGIWNDLSGCYPKLAEMSKNKVVFLGNKPFFSSETSYEPEKLNDEFSLETEEPSPYYEDDEFSR